MQNFDDISKLSGNENEWTLKNDIELKDALQNFGRNMEKNMNEMQLITKNLENKLFEMEIRLKHVHNRINCAKTERYIEEKVDDIDNIILAQRRGQPVDKGKKEISQKEYEQRTIRAISNAVLKGFEMLKTIDQGKMETPDPIDPSSSNSIQQQKMPVKLFNVRPLPPIIGTNEFKLFVKEKGKGVEINKSQIPAERNIPTKIKSNEEEDIGSISSNRSVPPQDPIVSEKIGQRNPLLEEIVGKMAEINFQNKEEKSTLNPEKGKEGGNASSSEERGKINSKESIFCNEKFKEKGKKIQSKNETRIPKKEDGEEDFGRTSTPKNVQLSGQLRTKLLTNLQGQSINSNENILTVEINEKQFPTKCKEDEGRGIGGARKSLFSSSSEDEGKLSQNERNRPSQQNLKKMESAKKDGGKLAKEEDIHSRNEESTILSGSSAVIEEMSKPVFKPFDSAFSDRLAAALQHGPIALRSDRIPAVRRPLSAQSIPSSGDEEFAGMGRTLRKTESSISSNEELGPTTVKGRIAQIGTKIPVPRPSGENEAKLERNAERIGDEQKQAPMPTEQNEALKNRVKGPTRRAPTKMAKSTAQIEPQKQEKEKMASTLPPVPPPKQKGKSIFSSSSSEDDLARLKNDLEMPKRKQQPPLPAQKTNQQMVGAKKDMAGGRQQRKGLFDDTDSDF